MNSNFSIFLLFSLLLGAASCYELGQKYTYRYQLYTSQQLSARDGAKTWTRMKLEAIPTQSTGNDLTLRFEISSISTNYGDVSAPTDASHPTFGIQSSFIASYSRGKLIEAKINPKDGKWAQDMKKSIVAMFQVQKSGAEPDLASYSSMEEAPGTECETIYTIQPVSGTKNYNVTKIRNYSNCTVNIQALGKKFSSPQFYKCTTSPEYSVPWIVRSTTVNYAVLDNTVRSIETSEKITFTLFGHRSSTSILLHGHINLETQAAASGPAEVPGDLVAVKLSAGRKSHADDFETRQVNLAEASTQPGMWPKPKDPVTEIVKTLEAMEGRVDQGMVAGKITDDALTMAFIELHLTLSQLNLNELQAIYDQMKVRQDSVLKIFFDALKYSPSNAAYKFMRGFITSGEQKEKSYLRSFLRTFPFRDVEVSKALLDDYLELCKQASGSRLERTCYLSLSNLLQTHCNPHLPHKHGCNPKVAVQYYSKMIETIRAVVPIGIDRDMLENSVSSNVLIKESLQSLVSRLKDPRTPIRRTATVGLFGFAHFEARTIRNVLWPIIMNRKEDHVVRIYAILNFMKTQPSISQFRAFTRFISEEDEDRQVAYYTYSLLKMMKHSPNPCYSGLSMLSKIGLREMMAMRARFHHTNLMLSQVKAYEAYDKPFGLGGATVLSYIINKKSLSASFYLEEKMVVNGYTGGQMAMLWETFPEEGAINQTGSIEPSIEGLDDIAATITREMAAIFNKTPKPASSARKNKMRLSFLLNGRVVDIEDPRHLTELGIFEPSMSKFAIPQQVVMYVPSEHGFTLFNLMVSGQAFFLRMGPMDMSKKGDTETLFRASLSPIFRRDTGSFSITGLKSPLGVGRAGIMTSVQRTHRLPLNMSYSITKKTAELKFNMPEKETDLVWYRVTAKQFVDPSNVGSIGKSLKPLFVDKNGQEQLVHKGKTFWQGFVGNGLRVSAALDRSNPMDGQGYRYMMLEESFRRDDLRVMRMKFEYGALIVPIDWRLTFVPDLSSPELRFTFNRTVQITDDFRSGDYQMSVLKGSQVIINTKVTYSYSTDFNNHFIRLHYNNYLRGKHLCFKSDIISPKPNFQRYLTTNVSYTADDRLAFNGSFYFDEQCSKKDIMFKGEFYPSEEQKDPKNIEMFSRYCGAKGLSVNKIPYCTGLHYHVSELRAMKMEITHENVPDFFKRNIRRLWDKGIEKYRPHLRYRSSEVTDPKTILVQSNSTWWSPYMYNVSYKYAGREEFWHNVPSTGLPWPSSYRLFDFHIYQAFHRALRKPYCYLQRSKLRTFDEWNSNTTIKPGCFKTLAMDCSAKNRFTVLLAQAADGKLETIEIYTSDPLKVEITGSTIKVNGKPFDPAVPGDMKTVKITETPIYKRISILKGKVRVYFDDVGISITASRSYFGELCGLCGNMNSCHHDDHASHQHEDHGSSQHQHNMGSHWLVQDERNTAKGCIAH